ncbi:MAG TPA: cysteine--tRNA ligase [Candidatus Saccharimonadia bacterium]|nr:cysteine--tRNA ligase [Candidatus Saccharimonadia bacterium]
MKLFNTLSRSIEEVVPLDGATLRLYACGPTVYDYTHLGHLRKYTMDDVLIRTIRHARIPVKHVENITDVGHLVSDSDTGEDKMEKGARKYGKSVWDIAKEFENYYWVSMTKMNNLKPDVVARATEHIPEQIALIKTLEEKGFTYAIDDGVYFDTSKFPNYAELAKIDAEGLQEGARVETVPGKKNITDFALWKFSPKDGPKRQMEWESPWGVGFPGWHIECSAMSMKYLGEQLDVHTGGIEHIPIHHTNEIAQSEAATGKHPFVKYWVHHNMLLVDGTKMSKSLGNFFTIDDIEKKGFSPMALRLMFLSAHYKSDLNFTWDNMQASQTAWEKLLRFLIAFKNEKERTSLSEEKLAKINEYRKRFFDQMENDLHTPEALAILWEVTKSNIPGPDKYDLLLEFDEVLGLNLATRAASFASMLSRKIPEDIQELARQRVAARKAGNFATSDALRTQLAEKGWEMKDVPSGYTLTPLS